MTPARRSAWALLLAAGCLCAAAVSAAPALEGVVVAVVDGDTIHVLTGGRREKVRYIGVDTPELDHPRRGREPFSEEAAAVNRALVAGKTARLELDVQRRDRHGRLLAYVRVGDAMVNAELVRRGYAQVRTMPPNVRYQELFRTLAREARQAQRGRWRPAPASADGR